MSVSWMFGGVAMFGIATIVFGLSTNFYLSMVALVVLGASDMVSVYVRHLLVQLDTPDYIRGRVSAVSSVFIGASNELGDFESGVMAKWWGAVRAVIIGGVATLVVTGLWARLVSSAAARCRNSLNRRGELPDLVLYPVLSFPCPARFALLFALDAAPCRILLGALNPRAPKWWMTAGARSTEDVAAARDHGAAGAGALHHQPQ